MEPDYGHKRHHNNDESYHEIHKAFRRRYPEKATVTDDEHGHSDYTHYTSESDDDSTGADRNPTDARYKSPPGRHNSHFIYGDIAASMYPRFPKDLGRRTFCMCV